MYIRSKGSKEETYHYNQEWYNTISIIYYVVYPEPDGMVFFAENEEKFQIIGEWV